MDVGSPTTYLAWTQLPGICSRYQAELVYRPMLLGGVFQATGNATPASVGGQGQAHESRHGPFCETLRCTACRQPFLFPINTLFLMRVIAGVQLRMPERFDDILSAVFKRMWVEPVNLTRPRP